MKHKICVIKGDGIGPEVVESALNVLQAFNLDLELTEAEAGYGCYKKHGTSIPQETINACKEADATLMGAVTTPPKIEDYKSAIVTLRKKLNLFANVRPISSYPIENTRQNIDMAIVRENTEGLYSGIERVEEDKAIAERVITRKGSERIIRYAFELAKKQGRNKVAVVHKANILRKTCGLFRDIAVEVAEDYKGIEMEEVLVDAMAMRLIKQPEDFQVIVTTNLFGDILSDEACMLVGGLGVAPSGNIGNGSSVFEPVHGSAPKYAGKDVANPIAAILSAKMMLEYLNENKAANKIEESVRTLLKNKRTLTKDLGGNSKTSEVTKEIINIIQR